METKQCPRCGEDMTFNPLVMDYVCDNCGMLEMRTLERIMQEHEDELNCESSWKRLMDKVDDER